MKIFKNTLLLFVILILSSVPSSSSAGDPPYKDLFQDIGTVVTTVVNTPGVELHPGLTKTEFKICQVRRIFCPNNMGLPIAAFAIFLVGIMLMDRKMSWAVALTIAIGLVVFINADKVAKTFGKQSWIFFIATNPMCNCNCAPPQGGWTPDSWKDIENWGTAVIQECVFTH